MHTRLRFSAVFAHLLLPLALTLPGCSQKAAPARDFAQTRIQGVRFDPSYYYNLRQPLDEFVDSAVAAWHGHGINTLFFKAYDPEYGAVYRTRYANNAMTDYGDKDLLEMFLEACHARGMRVIAWLPVFEHKHAWEAHPEWRVKSADGTDLMPYPDHHYLCVRQEGFVKWWHGFLKDLLDRHPGLDGVDFAEPAIVFKGGATCECGTCRNEIGAAGPAGAAAKRAEGLTDLLISSSRIVRESGRTACVTFIGTAARSADLLPFAKQKELTGLDIDRLLASPDRPQWLAVELMWQQWADTYDNPATFRPDWTRKAVEQALAEVGARAHLLAHVEITPLGPVEVSPDELVESIVAARKGGAQSVEFYDTHLMDSLGAWSRIEKAWSASSDRRAVVLHDPEGLGVAKQVAVLFGHFGLATVVAPVEAFADSLARPNDLLAYVGNKENHALPPAFLAHAGRPGTKIFWCDFNLGQLGPALDRLGLAYLGSEKTGEFATVAYKGQELFKTDSTLNRLRVLDSAKVKVHAWAVSKTGERLPYILQSGGFWYVADCPTDYIVEGGRDIAFADLLHEFVGETHPEKRTALVRIEDVCPLTDPKSIEAIADLLHAEGVPFSIALVPFYVDPEGNIGLPISEKPEFVKALKHAVKKGGAIVMHGSTHQYRGRSTYDYEFWDAIHDKPIFEDAREYVRARIHRGLVEMRKTGFYPVVFETPHYAGSQLDYSVIDEHFSAEYGRRQVIDQTGFDQLVPFFIARHPSGNSIIPENLGYIPNDRQEAAPLLRFAKNNLAVRDGFASFFFHAWIDKQVLKDLVRGIKGMGYEFADIRNIPLRVTAEGLTVVTGSQEARLEPQGKYLRTFFLDREGAKREEWVSREPVTQEFVKQVQCPPGWSFVAETLDEKPEWHQRFTGRSPRFVHGTGKRLLDAPPLKTGQGQAARPAVIWAADNPGQEAWARALSACGLDFDTLHADRFLTVPEEINLVVVPSRSAPLVPPSQALILSQWVAKGNAIILEGGSALAAELGLRAADSGKTVAAPRDDYLPQVEIKWPRPAKYQAFDADGEYVNQYSTQDDEPLVTAGAFGKGKYLFFATPFADSGALAGDPSAPYRFPFLLDMIGRELGLHPLLRSPSLEVYFDPGNREDVPVEQLAANWKRNGVRAVYLAAWHDYSKYTFEYAYMASLLHRAGILAYAWFDLPGISDRFWNEHPAWREKTAAGTDAEFDTDAGWKQYMDFTNDTARAGAYNSLKRMLLLAPWDGVVLTGRLFAGEDPDSAGRITPFNASFRAQYARDKGYDPLRIFDPSAPQSVKKGRKAWEEFLRYRDSLEQSLTAGVIDFMLKQRPLQKAGSEVILTRPLSAPSPAAAALYARLLAEEPQVRLQAAASEPLVHAAALARGVSAWREAFPKWSPMVEVDFERQKPASGMTPQLCGLELMELVASAARSGVRLSLRTEDHIYDTDFRNLAYAAAAPAREKLVGDGWDYASPGRAVVELDERANPEVLVDNRLWPAYDKGRLLLPAGEHRLEGSSRLMSWKTLLQAPARIGGFNGVLTEAANTLMGLRFRYRSEQPATLALSRRPLRILVDGLPLETAGGPSAAPAAAPPADETAPPEAVSLPAGEHEVEITTRPLATSVMRQASVWLSVAIILISSLTVAAFLLLYAGGWARRLYAGTPDENAKGKMQKAKVKIERERQADNA